MKKIVIDLMGSDLGESEIFEGALLSIEKMPQYGFVLVGDMGKIDKNNPVLRENQSRVELIHAESTFLNTDSPMDIPKGRDDTSLVQSLLKLSLAPD